MSATGIATDAHHEHQPDDNDPTDGDPADSDPIDDPAHDEPADDDPAGFEPANDDLADDDPADGEPVDGEPAAAAGHAGGGGSGRGARVMGRPLLALTIDHRWLQNQVGHATLDSGHTLSPATARRLACDAAIVPIMLGTRSEPLDVGRLSYTIPDGMRRTYTNEIADWLDHGETRIVNLTLLCVYHHHLVHHDHWHITMINGRPWYTPPRGSTPIKHPDPADPTPFPRSRAHARRRPSTRILLGEPLPQEPVQPDAAGRPRDRVTRKRHFRPARSVGKCPRASTARR